MLIDAVIGLNVLQLLAVLIIPNVTALLSFIIFTKVSFAKHDGEILNLTTMVKDVNDDLANHKAENRRQMDEQKRQFEREAQQVTIGLRDVSSKLDTMQNDMNKQMFGLSQTLGKIQARGQ